MLQLRGGCVRVARVDALHVQLHAQHALQDALDDLSLLSASQALGENEVAVLCQRLVAVGASVAPAAGEGGEKLVQREQSGGKERQRRVSSDKCLVCRSTFVARTDEWTDAGAQTRHLVVSSSETRRSAAAQRRDGEWLGCAPQKVARSDEAVLARKDGCGGAAALQLAHHLHELDAVRGRDLER